MWINDIFEKMYALFLSTAAKLFGLASAKRIDTFIRFRMKLDLSEPKTLAEKVTYIEFFRQSTLTSMCTDKFAVREYITKKGLADHLIPLVGGPWSSVEAIDFANLPESFVLKATHGCKMNYIVPIKRDLDEVKCRKEMQRWLRTTYGTYSLEPHYFDIPHRIYAEHLLGKQEDLVDYKFHCFNGEPHFIMASSFLGALLGNMVMLTILLAQLAWIIITILTYKWPVKCRLVRMLGYYGITIAAQFAGVYRILSGQSKPFWEKVESTR